MRQENIVRMLSEKSKHLVKDRDVAKYNIAIQNDICRNKPIADITDRPNASLSEEEAKNKPGRHNNKFYDIIPHLALFYNVKSFDPRKQVFIGTNHSKLECKNPPNHIKVNHTIVVRPMYNVAHKKGQHQNWQATEFFIQTIE